MYRTTLEQLVDQHTADLLADAAHRRLVRRSRASTTTAPCTPRAGGPSPCHADILADPRSATDDAPEPVGWLTRPWWIVRRGRVRMPGTASTRRVSATLVGVLLFLLLAAAATAERDVTGNGPTPVSTSAPAVHDGGGRIMVR